MALKAPNWAKNAIPTRQGWVDPNTGEVLVSRKFSERQITEYNILKAEKKVSVKPEVKKEEMKEDTMTPEMLTEIPVQTEETQMLREVPNLDEDLSTMTKTQLLEKAATLGVNIASNKTKQEIIDAIQSN